MSPFRQSFAAPPTPVGAPRGPTFRRDLLIVLALNTVVALALWLIVLALAGERGPDLRGSALRSHFVFSQCIGLSIFALIEGPRLTLWWQRPPGPIRLGLFTAAAIPVGYTLGRLLAAWWLGVPHGLPALLDPELALAVFITAVASLVAVQLVTQRDSLEAERLRAENADMRATRARLQLLQQQIEPHMLFNTLANVHALIDEEPLRAQKLLEALSALLHASMQTGEQPLVTLRQEFDLVDQYLKLMSLRMGPRLRHELHLPPALEACRLPPLALQPLVENAVRHGLDGRAEGGLIRVSAWRGAEGMVTVEVQDDGQGLQGADPFAGGRIGLVNLRRRLSYAFGDAASLTLTPRLPQGVSAVLSFPEGGAQT